MKDGREGDRGRDDGKERRRGGRGRQDTLTQVFSLFRPGMNRLPSALTVAKKGQRKRGGRGR